MRRATGAWALLALAVAGCAGPGGPVLPRDHPALDTYIRPKIRQAEGQTLIAVAGALLPAWAGLGDFYARHGDHLVWSTPGGPAPAARQFVQALREEEGGGLPAAPLHLGAIEEALAGWARGGGSRRGLVRLAELDLLLTSAFCRRAELMQGGRTPQPARDWVSGRYLDPGALLDSALASGQVREALEGLRPAHPDYQRLVQALAAHRRMQAAGGWPALRTGDRPRQGQQGPAEEALRRRLIAGGDLDSLGTGRGFDEEVEGALRRFQARHGLSATGRVDLPTLEALQVPVEKRVAQLEMNLERWRWLPLGPQVRYLLVRLDEYTLELFEGGRVALEMKIIAGKEHWRTPIFGSLLDQLVLNPYWNVPPAIAREEVLPAVRNDPGYLEQRGFLVVSGQGDQARVVAPDTLDWSAWPDEEWPYTFIQAPGPDNPLGRVKFLLPNPHSIYLHDTPNRELFARPVRDFSHGCIRLEKSFELATRLLAGNPGWTRTRIREVLQSGQTLQVALESPVPIYFSYWTARADESGQVHFRPDQYGADARLQEAWGR